MSIALATKQAKKSSFKYRLGAVIVKGGRILATGYNVVGKSTALFKQKKKERYATIHAEQAAIMKVLKQHEGLSSLAGSTLYVSRINKNGSVAMAMPCPVCLEAIKAVGIKRVVFTTNEGVCNAITSN